MNYLDDKYLHCLCEVRNEKNQLVAAGSIQEIDKQEFVIVRRNSRAQGLAEGIEVKVDIFNFSEGFCVVQGTIKRILLDRITISDVVNISTEERRQAFRVEIAEKGQVLIQRGKNRVLKEVDLRNISLGGCLIETKEYLGETGDHFELRFNFFTRTEVRMDCLVCRQVQEGEIWRTGCSFTAYPSGIEDKLCAYIFEQQRRQLTRK